LLYAAIAIIVLAGCKLLIYVALTMYVALSTLFVTPNFIDLETEIKKRLKIFLDHENHSSYNSKGLKWEMQPEFYWLELHIVNKK